MLAAVVFEGARKGVGVGFEQACRYFDVCWGLYESFVVPGLWLVGIDALWLLIRSFIVVFYSDLEFLSRFRMNWHLSICADLSVGLGLRYSTNIFGETLIILLFLSL